MTATSSISERAQPGREPFESEPPLGSLQREGFSRAGGWLSVFLLLVMLLSVAWSVNSAEWTSGLHLLQWMVLGGAVLGLALSQSRWRGIFVIFHATVSSLAWITLWASSLLPAEFGSRGRVYQLYAGINLWLQRAIAGATGTGSLIFVLILAIVVWWLAFAATWAVFRQQRVWRAVVPTGLLMLLNLYYAPTKLSLYFLLFTFCALMLAVRYNLAQSEALWRAERVRFAVDIGIDFLRDGLIFAALVLALAFFLPGATSGGHLQTLLRPFEGPWESIKEEWNRLFDTLQYPTQTSYAAFGKNLHLSGPVSLGDSVIMDVNAPTGHYWRAVVYHTYTGRGWINSDEESVRLGAGDTPPVPIYARSAAITQTITTYYPSSGVLFAAGQPLQAALPAVAEVSYVVEDDIATPTPVPGDAAEEDLPVPMDISMMVSRSRLREGDSYTIVSAISRADIESLREASDDYPKWVEDRYLQLPENLPQRIRDLALQITEPFSNAYDRVAALERYLRLELTYNDQIPPPPAGWDGVDYFLFGIEAGYCDYYASALATMARSLDIPARLAAGYTQGEYDEEKDAYRVRELNAHAWVEVFFPGYGWVEFEPTASETLLVRPLRPPEAVEEPPPESGLDEEAEDQRDLRGDAFPLPGGGGRGWPLSTLWTVLLALALLMLAAGGVIWWLLRRPLQASPHLLLQLYEKFIHWGERLRLRWLPHQTPNEQGQLMAQMVPEGRKQIGTITGLYVRERFGPAPAADEELASASQAWLSLRPMLWHRWLRLLAQPPVRFVFWRERWKRRLGLQKIG